MIYFGRKSRAARERYRRNLPQRPIENFEIRFQAVHETSLNIEEVFFFVRKSISSKTSIVPSPRGDVRMEMLEAEIHERWGEKLIGIKTLNIYN